MNLVPRALRNARDEGWLVIEWDRPRVFGHAQLRQACPCSQCRAARLRGRAAVVPGGVRLERLELQGYGVQMIFSDGHDRGIYPWTYLHGLPETLGAEAGQA